MRILQKALTFDDVLLVPAHSDVLPRNVVLSTKLTRELTLNLPMISAAMAVAMPVLKTSLSFCSRVIMPRMCSSASSISPTVVIFLPA